MLSYSKREWKGVKFLLTAESIQSLPPSSYHKKGMFPHLQGTIKLKSVSKLLGRTPHLQARSAHAESPNCGHISTFPIMAAFIACWIHHRAAMYDTGRSIWTTSRLVIAFIGITGVSVIFPLVLFLPPLTIMRGCFLFCVNVSSFRTPSPTRVSIPKIFSTLTSLILSYLVLKRLVFLSRFLGLINTVHKLISCAVDPLMDLCGRKWRVPPIPLTLWDPHHNPGRSI